jgi:hypothetical protein
MICANQDNRVSTRNKLYSKQEETLNMNLDLGSAEPLTFEPGCPGSQYHVREGPSNQLLGVAHRETKGKRLEWKEKGGKKSPPSLVTTAQSPD